MTAINSINTGLALLRLDNAAPKTSQNASSPRVLLAGPGEAADIITQTIHGSPDLLAQFEAFYTAIEHGDRPPTFDANSRHIATYETIIANRDAFPPGEFAIHTELPGGGSITTFIPAADGSTNASFEAEVATALQQVGANDSAAKLDALSRIADVFLMNPMIVNSGQFALDAYEEGWS